MKEKTKWNDYDALPLILDVTDLRMVEKSTDFEEDFYDEAV